MKNGDMPAMPQDRGIWVDGIGECPTLATGLTKREMMAMRMMAARVSIPGMHDDEFDAKRSVAAADTLLAELERTGQ